MVQKYIYGCFVPDFCVGNHTWPLKPHLIIHGSTCGTKYHLQTPLVLQDIYSLFDEQHTFHPAAYLREITYEVHQVFITCIVPLLLLIESST